MTKKSIYTKRLGVVVASGAKTSTGGKFHIVSSQTGKWAVVSEGSVRSLRAFATQEAAVNFAKQYAISKSGRELVIHDEEGRIKNKIAV